jgi:nucleoside-diphosphate-sugar epimerase
MNTVLKSDIGETLNDPNIVWNELRDSSVMITGASGMIESNLVKTLEAANALFDLKINIIAHTRDTHGDIREGINVTGADYIFHCAAITNSADMVAKPVDVIDVAVNGTRNLLEFAVSSKCRSFVYLSSMEAYGQLTGEADETNFGYLDLSNPRSSYPESKRLCESLCAAYFTQYNVPVKMARLARTFGAGVPNNNNDMRVASQFARCAMQKKDIELHTAGNSIANCCYTFDVIRGLFTVLQKGKNGEIYNVANPDASATIRQMAEIVANDVCKGAIKVATTIPEDLDRRGYAPAVGYTLNADKLKSLGWSPKYGLAEMFRRMIEDWKEAGEV